MYTPLGRVLVGRCKGHDCVSGGTAGPQLDQQVSMAQRLGAGGQCCGPAAGRITPDSLSH